MTRIELPASPQRILIIKPSALGDVVHTLPVLNLLRKRWPQAQISWLIGSSFAGLIQRHPQLDEVISFDRDRFSHAWYNPRSAMELRRFVKDLKRRQFDLVIDLQGLFRSGMLTALTRAPVRVGFSNAREWAHLFYTHHVPIDSMEQHAVDRYLAVTEALGCGRAPVEFTFVIEDADRASIDAKLQGIGRFALLLPGTNWQTKRWGAEKFAGLIAPLREQFGLSAVIAGGADAVPIAEAIAAHSDSVVDLSGKTNLRELVALIDRAEVVIANDSGPMHIGAATNKPLVTIFGPTNPVRTGPYQRANSVVREDVPCSPCYSRTCPHVSCMHWLKIESVTTQIRNQLNGHAH